MKKGISLIVLVITIIVMIILAASIVLTLNNTGIINKANEAKDLTNTSEVKQLVELAWSEAYLDNISEKNNATKLENIKNAIDEALTENGINKDEFFIDVSLDGVNVEKKEANWKMVRTIDSTTNEVLDIKVTNGNLNLDIGTPINYMPDGVGDTNYKGGWRLLGVDDKGRLLILANKSVTGDTLTLGSDEDIYKAAESYNNALETLQNAVSSYKDGIIGVEVRSLNHEDLDRYINYDKTTYVDKEGLEYGRLITYRWNRNNQVQYKYYYSSGTFCLAHIDTNTWYYIDEATGELIKSDGEAGKDITSFYNNYYVTDTSHTGYFNVCVELFNKGIQACWVADKYTTPSEYGVYRMLVGIVDYSKLVGMDGTFEKQSYNVGAVVTLASNVELKEGTVEGTYDIVLNNK